MAPAEHETALLALNGPRVPYPREACVPALFRGIARAHPGAPALVEGETALAYGDLLARVQGLARRLRARGVGRGGRVALALPRSIDFVTAVLAVLETGAAYVPLEASHPPARLRWMLEDAAPQLLLSRRDALGALGDAPVATFLLDEDDGAGAAGDPSGPLPDGPGPLDPAYVMYTSGSTGRPKGVEVPHRAIVRLVRGQEFVPMDEAQTWLLLAPTSFDASTIELWAPLLNGGRLAVFPGEAPEPRALEAALCRHEVTCLWLTAALFNHVVDAAPDALASLRHLLIGGEALSVPHVVRGLAALPGTAIVNGYGPTENTTFSATYAIPRDFDPARASVPIGRPIAHSRCYLLDPDGRPVGAGEEGELFVAGDGVALGYLNQPELTAERFLEDPFEPGARMYRTGDRCRVLEDGNLEYRGRLDRQVKIRGFRIEPGEIEAALLEHPDVRRAVVDVREAAGGKRLVGYVVGEVDDFARLEAFLAERLPASMVPTAWKAIRDVPLTPHGKVDRGALPAPGEGASGPAPTTATERALADLWRAVLDREAVGRDDDFFRLGGHSLSALALASRIEERFGVAFPLATLLEHASLGAMAEALDRVRAGGEAREAAGAQGAVDPDAAEQHAAEVEEGVLSDGEAALTLVERSGTAPGLYHESLVLHLEGRVDPDLLERALARIVARHDVLRTGFVEEEGVPRRRVRPPDAFSFRLGRSALGPHEDDDAAVERFVEERTRAPFDLKSPPLLRADLLERSGERSVLLLVLHHLVCDDATFQGLLGELEATAKALAAGREPDLPPPPTTMAEWARRQRARAERRRAEDEAFWREHLDGAEAPALVRDRHGEARPERRKGDAVSVHVPADLTAALEALAREEGTTLFATLFAAWAAFLGRLGAQEDIVVSTPATLREGRAVDPSLFGYGLHTLPVRANLAGRPSLRALTRRTHATLLGVQAHRELSLDRILAVAGAGREGGDSPLLAANLALLPHPLPVPRVPGARSVRLEERTGLSKFEHGLSLRRTPLGLEGALEFRSDLFLRPQVEAEARAFLRFLAGAVAAPDAALADLDLADEAERRWLSAAGEGTRAVLPAGSLADLFEEAARRRPDAVAVVEGETRTTYADLLERVRRLAAHLRAAGVEEGARVALALPRSTDLVTSVLATLSCGAVYVPLDAGDPPARLARVLAQVDPVVVVTRSGAEGAVPLDGRRVVRLDVEAAAIAAREARPLGGEVASEAPATILFTSGTTGEPKGVVVPHGAVVRLVFGQTYAPFDDAQTWLLLAPPHFDPSTLELFGALLHGARLVVHPDALPDVHRLGDLLRRERVTCLYLATALFDRIVDARPEILAPVRCLMVGGEALSVAHVRRAYAALPDLVIVNALGPTETTTFTLAHPVPRDLPANARSVPLGSPLSNTRVHVLDARLRPLPVGVPGELFVGGEGLALGYLGRDDLTGERFVPDPFAPGARLYRSGDRFRWMADGTLDYLGRVDRQVKVRGFRIEPEAVEAVLAEHPRVLEAVVGVRRLAAGDALVAWVVPREGRALDPADLRRFAAERLPAWSLPQAVVPIDRVPLTSHDKVDRARLPQPLDEAGRRRAPRTPTEATLVAIAGELLGRDDLGGEDDFFRRGGTSLLALALAARVESALGVVLPLNDVVAHGRLADLAAAIDRRLEEGPEAAGEADADTDPDAAGTDDLLSPQEEALWALERLGTGGAYRQVLALRLEGPLEPDLLARALGVLVGRHAAFRTRYPDAGGVPRRQVDPVAARVEEGALQDDGVPRDDGVPYNDAAPPDAAALRRVSAGAAGEEAIPAFLEAVQAEGFDLERGPLWRAHLLSVSPEDHVLALAMHHLVCDEWSFDVLAREWAEVYAALLEDRAPALPPAPAPYAAHARRRRRRLANTLEPGLEAWARLLEGAPEALDLPLDRRREGASAAGGAAGVKIGEETAARLRERAARAGTTPFTVLLAAWSAFLARLTGEDDVVVGTPVAERHRADVAGTVGYFLNTLPVRVRLEGHPSFEEAVAATAARWREVLAHADVPFARIVERLRPARAAGQTPWLGVQLVWLEPAAACAFGPARARTLDVPETHAKFDLTLALRDGEDGFEGTLGFRKDLFDAENVSAWARAFERFLEGALEAPDLALADVDWTGEDERARLLALGADTAVPYPRDATLPALFAEVAAAHADEPAVLEDDAVLPYGALLSQARRLAHHLRARGVGRGDRVAVALPRSTDFVVAVLATLEAGAAYVPLDVAHPEERLRRVLDDAGPRALVARSGDLGNLPPDASGLLLLDVEAEAIAARSDAPVEAGTEPLDAAYLLYTSGSTGRPKGVAVPHRAVVRLVRGTDFAPMDAAQTWLLLSATTFDLSTLELWAPLLGGGRTAVFPPVPPEPAALGRALRRHEVTCLWLTTGLFNQVVDADAEALARVRHLIVGGEALSVPHVARALGALSATRLVNGYGPTENTTFSTTWAIPRDFDGRRTSVPIGRPIANSTAYVLDAAGRLLPTGVAGELWVGGDGVALGYVDLEEETRARFRDDPFGRRDEAGRMYATGDRCRWRADGTLEYLGRLDRQLKVRGFRIEPGDVESALLEHEGVVRAVVDARDGPAGKALVGWVVPRAGSALEAAALRRHLGARLPDWMVPSAFVLLEDLPLTPHGKLDRARLPAPEFREEAGGRTPPSSPTERVLADIWQDLLGVDGVHREDDFFRLGGHSLVAIAMLARAQTALGTELPFALALEAPRLADLAAAIDARRGAAEDDVPAPIGAVRDAAPAAAAPPAEADSDVLSSQEEALWSLQRLGGGDAYNLGFVLRPAGPVDAERLARAWHAVVRRHDVLRTRFPEIDGRARRVVLSAEVAPAPVARHALEDGADRAEAALAAGVASLAAGAFDLGVAPPWRAALWTREGEGAPVVAAFAVVLHHVLVDEWSIDGILRDLEAAYERDAPLLPTASTAAREAARRRRAFTPARRAEGLEAWRAHLEGAPERLDLPLDRARPDAPSWDGLREALALDASVQDGLQALARREGTTLFSVALSLWTVLLRRWTGQADLVVGTPVSLRSRPELQDLAGYFLNTLPVRVDLEGAASLVHALPRVREAMRHVHANADVPFAEIVEALGPSRRPDETPWMNASFVLLPEPEPARTLGGAPVEVVPVAPPRAKFELTLSLRPDASGAMKGEIEARSDLFERSTMAMLARAFEHLARAAAADPERDLDAVPLASDEALAAALGRGQPAPVPYPRDATVPALFAEVARERGEVPALLHADGVVSYAALASRARRLAHHLRARGVEPGARVAIALPRSVDFVVAVLATLEAGAAYVPLDAAHPVERLHWMIEDAGATAIVTRADADFPLASFSAAVVRLDEEAAAIDARPDRPLEGVAVATDPAYVMYTSGSTGKPKGVVVPHRAVVRLVRGQTFAPMDADRTWLLLAPTSFDASTLELWAPLLNGGRLALYTDVVVAPDALRSTLGEHGVTCLWLTAALFNQIVDLDVEALSTLECLLVGGEALSVPHVRRALAALPDTRLVNGYGPTENTTFSTTHAIPRDLDPRVLSVPIGVPLANGTAYVLGPDGRPVPDGWPGELWVGGDGVARGYLDRPDLTAERFRDDPFRPGQRLYRTGDRCRRLPDGTLAYLGRLDRQVKLRGFRIEPGEIEAVLAGHEAVVQAVVEVRDLDGVGPTLLGWIVPAPGHEVDPAALAAWLARRLPAYMVPASLARLDVLPLTAHGKLDRARLPAALPRPSRERARAPRTDLERTLLETMGTVLGADLDSVHANFFGRGGTSLRAIELAVRLGQTLGREVPTDLVFRAPTVAEQAALLGGPEAAGRPVVHTVLSEGDPNRTLLFLPGLSRTPFDLVRLVPHLPPAWRCLGLHLPDPARGGERLDSIDAMASWLADRVLEVQPSGPYVLLGYSFSGTLAFAVGRELERRGRPVRLVVLVDTVAAQTEARPSWLARHRHAARLYLGLPRAAKLDYLGRGFRRVLRLLGYRWRTLRERALPVPAPSPDIRERLRHENWIPGPRGVAMMRAYRPTPVDFPVLVLRSDAFDLKRELMGVDPENNWGPVVHRGVDLRGLPFTHEGMLRREALEQIARILEDRLAVWDLDPEAEGRSTPGAGPGREAGAGDRTSA